MAVSEDDVRHVAELARLALDESRIGSLVGELNGILGHMDVLSQVDTSETAPDTTVPSESTPLRSDSSGPIPLLSPIGSFAPSMRDGFILVPRLATHEDGADSAT